MSLRPVCTRSCFDDQRDAQFQHGVGGVLHCVFDALDNSIFATLFGFKDQFIVDL